MTEATILVVGGAAILGLAILVIFMAMKRSWRRGPRTSEEEAMIAADPGLLDEEPAVAASE